MSCAQVYHSKAATCKIAWAWLQRCQGSSSAEQPPRLSPHSRRHRAPGQRRAAALGFYRRAPRGVSPSLSPSPEPPQVQSLAGPAQEEWAQLDTPAAGAQAAWPAAPTEQLPAPSSQLASGLLHMSLGGGPSSLSPPEGLFSFPQLPCGLAASSAGAGPSEGLYSLPQLPPEAFAGVGPSDPEGSLSLPHLLSDPFGGAPPGALPMVLDTDNFPSASPKYPTGWEWPLSTPRQPRGRAVSSERPHRLNLERFEDSLPACGDEEPSTSRASGAGAARPERPRGLGRPEGTKRLRRGLPRLEECPR